MNKVEIESYTAGLQHIVLNHLLNRCPGTHRQALQKFFSGVWSKWVFSAIISGNLDANTFRPTTWSDVLDPNGTDLPYFETKNSITLRPFDRSTPFRTVMYSMPVILPALTPEQQQRVSSLYTGQLSMRESMTTKLRSMYAGLEPNFSKTAGSSNFFSVPPTLIHHLQKINPYGKIHELFGSPFNTCEGSTYSSVFELEVTSFSSCGDAFAYIPPTKELPLMIANPPFDETILLNAAKFCFEKVCQYPDLVVLFVAPVWTNADFYTWISEQNSPFVTSTTCNDKKKTKFYNYGTSTYIDVSGACVYVFAQKPPYTAEEVVSMWAKLVN